VSKSTIPVPAWPGFPRDPPSNCSRYTLSGAILYTSYKISGERDELILSLDDIFGFTSIVGLREESVDLVLIVRRCSAVCEPNCASKRRCIRIGLNPVSSSPRFANSSWSSVRFIFRIRVRFKFNLVDRLCFSGADEKKAAAIAVGFIRTGLKSLSRQDRFITMMPTRLGQFPYTAFIGPRLKNRIDLKDINAIRTY